MSFRLTEPADADIERILGETLGYFGPRQVMAYAALIQTALELVGRSPFAPGTVSRDDLAPGVRMLHLERVARRRGAAAHGVYFLPAGRETEAETIILRILHERMEPQHRVRQSLSRDDERD